MPVAALILHLSLPGCASLKEKRGRVKPVLAGLHREFNVSATEYDLLDHRSEAVLACAVVSNDAVQCRKVLQAAEEFTRRAFRDIELIDSQVEFLA